MSKYENLERIKKLLDAGVISQEEYNEQKNQILNRDEKRESKIYTTCFIIGLIAFVLGGLIFGVIGVSLSSKAQKQLAEDDEKNGMVTAGFVFSILGIIKGFFLLFVVISICRNLIANSVFY